MAFAIYYAVKIVRLSDRFDYVGLRGGRAPYYIVIGLVLLEINRMIDLLTTPLSWIFGYQITITFNDPPAALAGFFMALGLREMYVVYIRNSQAKPLQGQVTDEKRQRFS